MHTDIRVSHSHSVKCIQPVHTSTTLALCMVSQPRPDCRQLSLFKQWGGAGGGGVVGGSPKCWNCLNICPCYLNCFVTAGLGRHASFSSTMKQSYPGMRRLWTPNLTPSIRTPRRANRTLPLHCCCLINFHEAAANRLFKCVIMKYEKQGRAIIAL